MVYFKWHGFVERIKRRLLSWKQSCLSVQVSAQYSIYFVLAWFVRSPQTQRRRHFTHMIEAFDVNSVFFCLNSCCCIPKLMKRLSQPSMLLQQPWTTEVIEFYRALSACSIPRMLVAKAFKTIRFLAKLKRLSHVLWVCKEVKGEVVNTEENPTGIFQAYAHVTCFPLVPGGGGWCKKGKAQSKGENEYVPWYSFSL